MVGVATLMSMNAPVGRDKRFARRVLAGLGTFLERRFRGVTPLTISTIHIHAIAIGFSKALSANEMSQTRVIAYAQILRWFLDGVGRADLVWPVRNYLPLHLRWQFMSRVRQTAKRELDLPAIRIFLNSCAKDEGRRGHIVRVVAWFGRPGTEVCRLIAPTCVREKEGRLFLVIARDAHIRGEALMIEAVLPEQRLLLEEIRRQYPRRMLLGTERPGGWDTHGALLERARFLAHCEGISMHQLRRHLQQRPPAR